MGKCKDCGAPVEDGEEYCESCLLLRDLGLNEDANQEDDHLLDDIEGLLPADDSDASDLNIDDDFLNFIGNDSEAAVNNELEDIMALDDTPLEEEIKASKNSDVGDILSDALGVLNDPVMDDMENDIFNMIPEHEQKKELENKTEEKEKKGLFSKVFGNVPGPAPNPDEPTEEEIEAKKKAEAEEKKKAKAEKKAELKAAKEAKAKEKSDAKAVKKAEKKRLKEEEAQNAPIDTSKINKVGASIVFVFAACIVLFIVIGTNTFTYAHDVSSAKDYFNKKQYTKAYQQIAGTKVKTKDEKTYDRIMTVMYVNKQYNSYQNYYNMEMYPEALDSLIKGLERYHKYSEQAKDLEVKDDLDYVKSDIQSALKDSFGLSEDDVQYLMDMDSQTKYSKEVTRLSKEN